MATTHRCQHQLAGPPSPHLRPIDPARLRELHPDRTTAEGERYTPLVHNEKHGTTSIYLDMEEAGTAWHLVDEWTIEYHPSTACRELAVLDSWPCTLYVSMGDCAFEGKVCVKQREWRRAFRLEIQPADPPKRSWADMEDDE